MTSPAFYRCPACGWQSEWLPTRPEQCQACRAPRLQPMWRCSGPYCPGLGWPTVNTPHPTSCRLPARTRTDSR